MSVAITDSNNNQNPFVDCNYKFVNANKCISLSVDYPKFYRSSNYNVESIPYTGQSPYLDYNEGIPLKANDDDKFFAKIEIPFKFCFFNQTYQEVIVGSNGVVSFTASQLGNDNYPNFTDSDLPLNSIFVGMNDMVFSSGDESEVYYQILGNAPCRKLVVNFYKGKMSVCNERATSQLVLHEGTNEIEIFIKDKPLPCNESRYKQSVIGIKNNDIENERAILAPGRSTGLWSTSNEAWKFSPIGSQVIPEITWYENDVEVAKGLNYVACPKKSSKYIVEVSYALCNDEKFVLKDDIDLNFSDDFPLSNNYTEVFCNVDSQNINLNNYRSFITTNDYNKLNFKFFRTQQAAHLGINPISLEQSLEGVEVFYVRVENKNDPDCYTVARLELNFVNIKLKSDVVNICDSASDGIEKNYNLRLLNTQILNANFNGGIQYFLSQEDAENNRNTVINTDISSSTQIWVRLNNASCSAVFGPLKINFNVGPKVNSDIEEQKISLCDELVNNMEGFDFTTFNSLVTTDPNHIIQYFSSYNEAFTGNGRELDFVRNGIYTVYARVTNKDGLGCFTIVEIPLNVDFINISARDEIVYLCFDGKEDIGVNLNDYAIKMFNQIEDEPVEISFYDNEFTPLLPNWKDLQLSSNQIIIEDGNIVRKTFWVRFTTLDGCYNIKKLTIELIHLIPFEDTFDICDIRNDGKEKVNLSTFNSRILGTQGANIKYFSTLANAQANTGNILTTEIKDGTTVYIRIGYEQCLEIYPITFKLLQSPTIKDVTVVRNLICDNNNDGVELIDLKSLENQIINVTSSSSSSLRFTYYSNFDEVNNTLSNLIEDPTKYVFGTSSKVYVKVEDSASNLCYNVAIINLEQSFLPPIVVKEATLQQCSFDSSTKLEYELSSAISQMFDPSQNTTSLDQLRIEYFRTENQANAGLSENAIPSLYYSIYSEEEIWVRFTDTIKNCYSVGKINLQGFLPPKTTLISIPACDTNNDGLFEINLLQFKEQMVYDYKPYFIYQFFKTQTEAEDAKATPISDPQNYTFSEQQHTVWLRVESIAGCPTVAPVKINVQPKIQLKNKGPFIIDDICDELNDGKEILNLTRFQNQILEGATFTYYANLSDLQYGNPINSPSQFEYIESFGNKIWVKVEHSNGCPDFVEINIQLKKSPMFNIEDQIICPNGAFADFRPDLSHLNIRSYEWKNANGEILSRNASLLNVREKGNYSLTVVSENGCAYTANFRLEHFEVPVITEIQPYGNGFRIIATGSKPIEYSMDNRNWQSSPDFLNVPNGISNFYVRFVGEECLGLPKQGLIPIVYNTITPNGDGVNDVWKLEGLHVFDGQNSSITIFDRYQKQIYKQNSNSELTWDGTYNGRPLSTDSYWYVIQLPDGRVINGWILLKNRN